jgi:hypothetical protein
MAQCIACFCKKLYQCYLTCHWLFAMMCGFRTMGYRPISFSTHIFLADGLDGVVLLDHWTWTPGFLHLGTLEGTCLQRLTDWHGRLGGKIAWFYGIHWCRHFTTGASQYLMACSHMFTNAGRTHWTPDYITHILCTAHSLSACNMHYVSMLCHTVRWTLRILPVQCYCFLIKCTC